MHCWADWHTRTHACTYIYTYVLVWWRIFCTFWHHDALFNVLMYFLTSRHISWRHDVTFDIMTHFLCISTLWRTFWRHNVHLDIMTYFLTLWHNKFCIFHSRWRHDVLFMLWHTFGCHGVLYDVILFTNEESLRQVYGWVAYVNAIRDSIGRPYPQWGWP